MSNKKIMCFFIITFVWSWILWTPFVLPTYGVYEMTEALEGMVMVAVMLGAFGPVVAAVSLSYIDGGFKEIKRFFKKCLNVKINYKYYIIAIFLSLGITASAHFFTNLTGIDNLPNSLLPPEVEIPLFILVLPYTLMLFFLGGGQEEFGWRGYIQDPLQDKLGVIKASLFIGLMWSVWHAPLWLIEGEGHAYYSFVAFLIYTTSWSLTIGIIYNISGKKMVIPWVMHTVANLSVPLFPVLFLEDVPQPGYWVWTIMNVIVAIILTIWYVRREKNVIV